MDFEDRTEEILLAACALRPALEAYAAEWRERYSCPAPEGRAITSELCRGGAYGLLLHLRERIPDAEWRVDGGYGSEVRALTLADGSPRPDLEAVIDTLRWPGGMRDPAGVWRGHFWVRGRLADGTEVVVDLTADQFGYDDVVVAPASDPRYRSNLRKDIADYGMTMPEMAWGHGLDWTFQRDWACAAPAP